MRIWLFFSVFYLFHHFLHFIRFFFLFIPSHSSHFNGKKRRKNETLNKRIVVETCSLRLYANSRVILVSCLINSNQTNCTKPRKQATNVMNGIQVNITYSVHFNELYMVTVERCLFLKEKVVLIFIFTRFNVSTVFLSIFVVVLYVLSLFLYAILMCL